MSVKQQEILNTKIREVIETISAGLCIELNNHEMRSIGNKCIETLEKNLYSDISSIGQLTPADWISMDLPLRIYTEIRRSLEALFKDEYSNDSLLQLLPPQLNPNPLPLFCDIKTKENDSNIIIKPDPSKTQLKSLHSAPFSLPALSLSAVTNQDDSQTSPTSLGSSSENSNPLALNLSKIMTPKSNDTKTKEEGTKSDKNKRVDTPKLLRSPRSNNLSPRSNLKDSPRTFASAQSQMTQSSDNIKRKKKSKQPKIPFRKKSLENSDNINIENNIGKDSLRMSSSISSLSNTYSSIPKFTIFLHGNETVKTQFIQDIVQAGGESVSSSDSRSVTLSSISYDQAIEIQFFSQNVNNKRLSNLKSNRPRSRSSSVTHDQVLQSSPLVLSSSSDDLPSSSGALFVFSVIEPNSFMYIEYLLKSEIDIKKIQGPIFIVGLNANQRLKSKMQAKKYVCEPEAHHLALKINALHYFEFFNFSLNFSPFLLAVGRAAIRKKSFEENLKFSKCLNILSNFDQKKVSLKKKQLYYPPNQLLHIYAVQKINLTGNFIHYFPVEFQFLAHLNDLNLSDNLITVIDDSMIANFTQLKKLNLENNQLDNFPIVQVYKMLNFSEIKLKGNPLNQLSSKFRFNGKKSNIIISKIPVKKYPIFGERLKSLLDNDRYFYPHIQCPLVIHKIFNWIVQFGLDKQGILRATGNQSKINKLKNSLSGSEINLGKENIPLEISSLLKIFLRELPDPIFPTSHFHELINSNDISSHEEWKKSIQSIFGAFKEINIKIIWCLIRLIRMISLNSHINLMPLSNVCKMISPNIIRPPLVSHSATSQQQVNAQISAISCSPIILESLINHSYELFDNTFDPFNYLDLVAPDLPFIKNILYQKLHAKNMEKFQTICSSSTGNNVWICIVEQNKLITRILNPQSLEMQKEITILEEIAQNELGEIQMEEIERMIWISNSHSFLQLRHPSTGEIIDEMRFDNIEKFKFFFVRKGVVWLISKSFIRIFQTKSKLKKYEDISIENEVDIVCSSFVGSTTTVWQSTPNKTIRIWDCAENKLDKEVQTNHQVKRIELANEDEVWLLSEENIVAWDVYSVTFLRTISTTPLSTTPLSSSSSSSPSFTFSTSSPLSSRNAITSSLNNNNNTNIHNIIDMSNTKSPNRSKKQKRSSSIIKSMSYASSLSSISDDENNTELLELDDTKDVSSSGTQIYNENNKTVVGLKKIGYHVWVYHANDSISIYDSSSHALLGTINNYHRAVIKDIICTQGSDHMRVYTISDTSLVMWLVINSPLETKLKWKFLPAAFDFGVEQNYLKNDIPAKRRNTLLF